MLSSWYCIFAMRYKLTQVYQLSFTINHHCHYHCLAVWQICPQFTMFPTTNGYITLPFGNNVELLSETQLVHLNWTISDCFLAFADIRDRQKVKNCFTHLYSQEMKLNTCFASSAKHLSVILAKLSTSLKLTSYQAVYLRDFPAMVNLDLCKWSSVIIPDKIQPPVWFPTSTHTLPYTLSCILRTGTLSEPVYHLPGITKRLEALIKVSTINQHLVVAHLSFGRFVMILDILFALG